MYKRPSTNESKNCQKILSLYTEIYGSFIGLVKQNKFIVKKFFMEQNSQITKLNILKCQNVLHFVLRECNLRITVLRFNSEYPLI